jgi:hypothetical protein
MSISYIQNEDSGLTARTIINQAIDGVNTGTFPYTGSAKITGSLEITGSTRSTLGFTGSLQGTATTASYVLNAVSSSYAITASYALNGGGGGSTDTGSLLMTASVSSNVITFTKGNGTTFPITVDTGSGGGGSTFPYTGTAKINGSLEVTGSLKLVKAGDISNDGLLYYDGTKGVVNDPEFTLRASTITGGTSGTMDLTLMGTTGGSGLLLPLSAPASPVAGSTYFEVGPNKLWVFDGSQWVSTELRP